MEEEETATLETEEEEEENDATEEAEERESIELLKRKIMAGDRLLKNQVYINRIQL